MEAPREAVEAAQSALGCRYVEGTGRCVRHAVAWHPADRGCPEAARAADAAVEALGLTWAHDSLPRRGGSGVVPPSRNAVRWAAKRLVGPWVPDEDERDEQPGEWEGDDVPTGDEALRMGWTC